MPSLLPGLCQHLVPEVSRAVGALRRQERHLLLSLSQQVHVQGGPERPPHDPAPSQISMRFDTTNWIFVSDV